MEPVGSATSTSDYDASLVGSQSGLVTARFNEMFDEIFHKPSEEVFDTNIYAFSLEYAMPYIYVGLSDDFIKNLKKMNEDDKYKIQDLVSALYKIRKYDFEDAKDKNSKGVGYTQLKNTFIESKFSKLHKYLNAAFIMHRVCSSEVRILYINITAFCTVSFLAQAQPLPGI